MNDKEGLSLLAERVILCEESQDENNVFLTIDMSVCTDQVNANNEGVSKEFIEAMVAQNNDLAALPLYADVAALKAKKYDKLTHMYNRISGRFSSTQIGGLINFRSEDHDDMTELFATARVPKREKDICDRLIDLYNLGALCFSFEVKYRPEDTHDVNGALIIDAAEHNCLTGVAVVTTPAFASSVALDMVAEADSTEDTCSEETIAERGETEMPKENPNTEEVAVSEEVSTDNIVEAGKQEEEISAEAAKREKCAEDGAPNDEEEKDDGAQATAEDANAEIKYEAVEVRQEYCAGNPQWGEPATVRTTEEHTVVETVDDDTPAIAEENNEDINALKQRIAELEVIAEKYNAIVAENEARELAEKQKKAKAFAEKNGLDVENVSVAEAIKNVDYEALANMSMEETAEDTDMSVAEATIALVSYAEIKTEERFGNMLDRKQ